MKANTNPKDLRLGNYIGDVGEGDKYYEVTELSATHITAGPMTIYPAGFIHEHYIPLSPEWLARLGAVKEESKEGFRYAIGHMDYSYVLEPRNDFGFKDGGYFMGIRYDDWDADPITINRFAYLKNGLQYVHQLQNLFQALTGEELTLKP